MSLLTDDFLSYLSWWKRKKELQIFVRSHLSHVLAFLLVILVLGRELPEIYGLLFDPGAITLWHVFILVITLGTVGAAVWDFFGNKLGTTPQEIRFVLGIRSLLIRLEKFKRETAGRPFPERFDKFKDFSSLFLTVTSNALCGKKDIAGGLMIYQNERGGNLALHTYTPGSMYQPGLEIPLVKVKKDEKGPAARAFESGLIAYMPKKNRKIGVLLEAGPGESYSLVNMFRGWYRSQSDEEERFGSVLSVPISIYETEGNKTHYGIVNYTTVKGDSFVHRDYIMAECFASIIAQAIYSMLSDGHGVQTGTSEPTTEAGSPSAGTVVTKSQPRTRANHPPPKGKKTRKARKR